MKASEIAILVGGELEGGADPVLTGVAPLDRAGAESLSFLANARYLPYLQRSSAGAVLVSAALAEQVPDGTVAIRVRDVHQALARVLPVLYPERVPEPGVHPTAAIAPGARLGSDVVVGPYAVIGRDSVVGDRSRIGAHSVLGEECHLSEDVVLHAHVTLYDGTRVGPRSILHSGARIGVDGFGYVPLDGVLRKIPQVGRCVIGADVEVGANTTIDRGSVGATEIGDGVKIDNLVHIGHNVRIGERSIVVAQVGIAGSARIGRGVTLAGQAGVNGHTEVGDGATIAGQSAVFGEVPAGATYSGYPARPHREAMRAQASLFRLPKIMKRLSALERAILGREAAEE